jgi:TPR repeat protein
MATEHNTRTTVDTLIGLEQQVKDSEGKKEPSSFYTGILIEALPFLPQKQQTRLFASKAPNPEPELDDLSLGRLYYIIGYCLRSTKNGCGSVGVHRLKLGTHRFTESSDVQSQETRSKYAMTLLDAAANLGNFNALNFMQSAYATGMNTKKHGIDVPQNQEKAKKYRQLRIQHNEPVALFHEAQGTADRQEALALYQRSHAAGYKPAACYIATSLYPTNPTTAVQMWTEFLTTEFNRIKFDEELQARDSATCEAMLGLFRHYNGTEEKSLAELERYLLPLKARLRPEYQVPFQEACIQLSASYAASLDITKAIFWAKEAKLMGHQESKLLLATYYLTPGEHYNQKEACALLTSFIKHNAGHPKIPSARFILSALTFPEPNSDAKHSPQEEAYKTWEALDSTDYVPATQAIAAYQTHSFGCPTPSKLSQFDLAVHTLSRGGDRQVVDALLVQSTLQGHAAAAELLFSLYTDDRARTLAFSRTIPATLIPFRHLRGIANFYLAEASDLFGARGSEALQRKTTTQAKEYMMYAARKGDGEAALFCLRRYEALPVKSGRLYLEFALVAYQALSTRDEDRKRVDEFLKSPECKAILTQACQDEITFLHPPLRSSEGQKIVAAEVERLITPQTLTSLDNLHKFMDQVTKLPLWEAQYGHEQLEETAAPEPTRQPAALQNLRLLLTRLHSSPTPIPDWLTPIVNTVLTDLGRPSEPAALAAPASGFEIDLDAPPTSLTAAHTALMQRIVTTTAV